MWIDAQMIGGSAVTGFGRPPVPPKSGRVVDAHGVEWRYMAGTKKWWRVDEPIGATVSGGMRWTHLVTYRGPVREKEG